MDTIHLYSRKILQSENAENAEKKSSRHLRHTQQHRDVKP